MQVWQHNGQVMFPILYPEFGLPELQQHLVSQALLVTPENLVVPFLAPKLCLARPNITAVGSYSIT